jgi:hypothetical protein
MNMTSSNHDVDPDLVNDPLLDLYHCVDGAQSPEEMQCRNPRKFLRNRRTFRVDISG